MLTGFLAPVAPKLMVTSFVSKPSLKKGADQNDGNSSGVIVSDKE